MCWRKGCSVDDFSPDEGSAERLKHSHPEQLRRTITAMMEGRDDFLCGVVEGKLSDTLFMGLLMWEP